MRSIIRVPFICTTGSGTYYYYYCCCIIYSWSIPRLAIHLSHYYFFFSFSSQKKELLRGKKNARRRAQSVGWEEARSER